ncbi:capsular exopolysaccharide family [Raineyella antarctica]|uniref:Capsular exopolysaccharide family n=1 Tax=Raineyella antarctica TaxID=1577474 RepID=A0A1G6GCY6_9ACTN|nr:polysaccharide biosynthesis tyrosine autokinase [Raineyella antarctica]SDB79862.1 capsular exopolysaccharide family [Raineyella antarctica]
MQLRDFLAIIRARWITIVLTLLLVLAATVVTTLRIPPTYQASARVFLAASSSPKTSANAGGGYLLTSADLNTYVELLNSPVVLDPLRKTLGVSPSTPLVVTAVVSQSSPVLDITVQAESPKLAADAANAVGPELAKVGGAYAPLLASAGQGVTATAISSATAPSRPISPNLPRNVALGLLAGLGLGIGLALIRHFLDTRVRTEADVRALSDRPILGSLRLLPKSNDSDLVVEGDPHGLAAEEYRRLRTNLQFADVTTGGKHSFAVSSAMPSEGKTTTAVNLALAMADSGARVLLVDADLRHPSVAGAMGIEGGVGLTTVLLAHTTIENAAQRWGDTTLYILPSGAIPPNPSELLGSSAMEALFAQLLAAYDYVIVDAPPILPVVDPVLIDRLVGGMLIVVAADRTLKRDLAQAVRSLNVVEARIAGFALNMVQNSDSASRYGAYYPHGRNSRATRGGRASRIEKRRSRPVEAPHAITPAPVPTSPTTPSVPAPPSPAPTGQPFLSAAEDVLGWSSATQEDFGTSDTSPVDSRGHGRRFAD